MRIYSFSKSETLTLDFCKVKVVVRIMHFWPQTQMKTKMKKNRLRDGLGNMRSSELRIRYTEIILRIIKMQLMKKMKRTKKMRKSVRMKMI